MYCKTKQILRRKRSLSLIVYHHDFCYGSDLNYPKGTGAVLLIYRFRLNISLESDTKYTAKQNFSFSDKGEF